MQTHQPWYQRHCALLCLAVLLLIQWGAWQLLPDPAETWTKSNVDLLPLKHSQFQKITRDPATSLLEATSDSAAIVFPAQLAAGTRYVKLTIRPEGPFAAQQWTLTLQYSTSDSPYFESGMIQSRSLRPLVNQVGALTELSWQLPVTAESFRIVIPTRSRFFIDHLQLAGIQYHQDNWNTWRQAIKLLCLAMNIGLLFAWLARYMGLLRRVCSRPALLSVLLLGIHGGIMIWLLPPFQGPDENRHWREAVKLFRSDGQPGSVLYQLPIILDAESPRWQSQIPFHALNLHAIPQIPREGGETKGAPYVKHWGYPIVGLVSLLFPPVQTMHEAITFYYCCRVAALLFLLGLVAVAWRWGLGSWTLVTFLSFPLVMQQCIIVSTDMVHNLGTLLAILLFRRHQLLNTSLSWLLLFLVCCLVVASKPPAYLLIMLLPAWFIPWSTLRQPKVWIPVLLAFIAISALGIWFLWGLIDKEGHGVSDMVRKQLDYLLTGPGFVQFVFAALEYPARFLRPHQWWEALGWLDTNLNDLHRALLWISLAGAVALDLGRWARWLRTAGIGSLWSLVSPLLACMLHLLFVWWSLALIMYLTISDYQSAGITGMQVRYMIPVALLFLTWPAAMLSPALNQPSRTSQLIWPAITLLVLAITHAIQLAIDLHYRYWS